MHILEVDGHGLNVERIARYSFCLEGRRGRPVLVLWFAGLDHPLRLVGGAAEAVLERLRETRFFSRLEPPQGPES